jgi:alkylresorcinol/alkylpyrone synthase
MSHVVAIMPVPAPHAHPQAEITSTIGPILAPDPARRAVLERLHSASGVERRALALPLAEYAGLRDFGAANDAFVRIGTELGGQAVRGALDRAGLTPSDVDLLVFTTVTGVSAPSLDALLVEPLGLRRDVRRLPSFGLGCAGGAAGLARVHDYLLGHPRDVAVLLSVELCSLTIQHGDDSTANLVASGLFGDGAGAAVLVGAEHALAATGGGPRVVDSASRLYPGTQEALGWTVGGSGLRIVLSPGLPDLVSAHLGDDVAAFLETHDLKTRDIGAWVVHAGGPRILDAVRDALDLEPGALAPSRASLAGAGNLSSTSVLDVLASYLDSGCEPGTWGLVIAFGPGVGVELVLLRWE